MKTVRIVHVSADIDGAIRALHRGQNIFDCSPATALKALRAAKAEGKRYYCGCDSVCRDGSCMGHEVPADECGKPIIQR